MTEKAILEEVDKFRIHYAELSEGIPEAGGIAFMTVYLDGVPINVTARARNPYDALAGLSLSVRLATKALGISASKPQAPQAPAPNPDPAAAIVRKDNPAMAEELEIGYQAVPPPPTGKTWEITEASRIVILPKPDDKITVEFYEPDKKYPSVKVNKWKIPEVAGLLKFVTSADVSKAAEFSCPCKVYWTQGKEFTNQEGEKRHYKDVAHVRPL